MGTLDGIIDTVSAVHPMLPLFTLLKSHGKLVLVGAPEKPLELPVFPLITGMCMRVSRNNSSCQSEQGN
jgi:cinnamyl-alcohol dehydrogenase